MIDLIECPEIGCDAPAEVVDRFLLGSTEGPVEYVKTYCLHRHILIVPRKPRMHRH